MYLLWCVLIYIAAANVISYYTDPLMQQNRRNLYLLIIILSVIIFCIVLSIWRYVYILQWFKKRTQVLIEYSSLHGYSLLEVLGDQAFIHVPNTMLELGKRDKIFNNIVSNNIWTFGDYSYSVYKKTKSDEVKVYTVYYSVCYIQLPRKLPNVFFDAKKTKGREFKKRFDDSQRHSLEGNFDTYFDTYFPPHYTVDSLSFITPEVMQALIAAKNYDVEINNNKVYIYGSLQPMPDQLIAMTSAVQTIYTALLNNITTYRDERIAYEQGRQKVSIYGEELRKSRVGDYFTVVFGAIIVTAGIGLFIYEPSAIQPSVIIAVIGGGMFLAAQKRILKERAWRRNAKMMHEAHKKRNTTHIQSKHIAK